MAVEFTLLAKDQIWGDNALDVIKKYGERVAPTDLASILGAYVSNIKYNTSENEIACQAWTRDASDYDDACIINCDGLEDNNGPYERGVSIRPVIPASETAKLTPSATKKGVHDVDIALYGEYPQTVADEQTNAKLEQLFKTKSLKLTGKSYTFDTTDYEDWNKDFQPETCPEYEYQGEKYIRIFARYADCDSKLSNGEWGEVNKPYWVRVEPVEWLIDPSGVWISKKCLLSGIQFKNTEHYDGNFRETFMKRYLDTYFSNEMRPSTREIAIRGLKKQLEDATNPEAIGKAVGWTKTPERKTQAERIIRVRRAKEILAAAAQKAKKEGDTDLLQEIIEIAKPYAARDAAIRNKTRIKRLERRSKKGRE